MQSAHDSMDFPALLKKHVNKVIRLRKFLCNGIAKHIGATKVLVLYQLVPVLWIINVESFIK